MNPNRPARLNRALLAVIGLICLVAGVFVLLTGTGLLARIFPQLPVRSDVPLLASPLVLPGWAPWVAIVASVLVGLLVLRWMVAQAIRRPASSRWQLAPDTRLGVTRIDSDAAAAPLAAEIEDYPGVRSASAHLVGERKQPRLYLRVDADDRADISDLRHRIDHEAIPRLVQALDLPPLRAELLLRLDVTEGARTR